jgi:FAD/FMN-containing dehydrogenase
LRPRSDEHVSEVLRYCNSRKLAVVPQGGNTGLVGGSVPVFDEIVLSTALLNKTIDFDQHSGILTCEAGCVLESLEKHVNQFSYTMPLDLGAKGSCHIGGNLATNAGGARLLRYGSLHGSVLGIKAILPDGTIFDNLSTLRKDNTGYDLKHLFIGSEGTLGCITAASVLCPPLPATRNVAFLSLPSFDACLKTLALARKHLGEILSAFEFLDKEALDLTLHYVHGIQAPLPDAGEPFYVLVETSGSNAEHDNAKLEAFLSDALEQSFVVSGTVARDLSQAAALWKVRENITEGLRQRGATFKYDVSIPLSDMYRLVEDVRHRLTASDSASSDPAKFQVKVVGYGHLGDGNLHLNVSVPEGYSDDIRQQLEPYVYEWTSKVKGSVSAEHGIGVMKTSALHYSKSQALIDMMKSIKRLIDPNGIMNPYKVLNF